MKKTILLITLLLLLTGCATTNMTKPDMAPALTFQPNKATLVILRETSFGGAIAFWNYLDRKLIGETTGRSYFITQVEPGEHYVVVSVENTAVAKFNFKAGKTYFLGEGVTMGVWRARTSGFYPMTKEAAEKAMQKCTYLEYHPTVAQEDMEQSAYKEAIGAYQKDVNENPDAYKDILAYDGVLMQ